MTHSRGKQVKFKLKVSNGLSTLNQKSTLGIQPRVKSFRSSCTGLLPQTNDLLALHQKSTACPPFTKHHSVHPPPPSNIRPPSTKSQHLVPSPPNVNNSVHPPPKVNGLSTLEIHSVHESRGEQGDHDHCLPSQRHHSS